MPSLTDYAESIRGYFLHGFKIPDGSIKFLHDWKIPVPVAVEMCAVSIDPRKMPPIPEARALADLNSLRAELVGSGIL